METKISNITVRGPMNQGYERILTKDALQFLEQLERKFGPRRRELLQHRKRREEEIQKGKLPQFLKETESIRQGNWTIAPLPKDLQDRRVEITGPVDRKMIINALNSGAKVFMACFEDATSPTWENIIEGQIHLKDAVNRTISFTNASGKKYELNDEVATLISKTAWIAFRRKTYSSRWNEYIS